MNPIIVALLLLILAASIWIFAALVRRETVHRRQLAMREWAAMRSLRLLDNQAPDAFAALGPLTAYSPRVSRILSGERITIAKIHTEPSPTTGTNAPFWNVLMMRIDSQWHATGLRPTQHAASLIDLFPLTSFPSLSNSERFMVFGDDPLAARALASSSATAELPPDLGLLMTGQHLILDFTSRPFDEPEFERMITIARGLAERISGA